MRNITGYHGSNCQYERDPCDSSPCQNSGSCETLPSNDGGAPGYRCHCQYGYKGMLLSYCCNNADVSQRKHSKALLFHCNILYLLHVFNIYKIYNLIYLYIDICKYVYIFKYINNIN